HRQFRDPRSRGSRQIHRVLGTTDHVVVGPRYIRVGKDGAGRIHVPAARALLQIASKSLARDTRGARGVFRRVDPIDLPDADLSGVEAGADVVDRRGGQVRARGSTVDSTDVTHKM